MRTIFLILLLIVCDLESASLVYNLRIAESTKRQAVESPYRKPSLAVIALVSQFSKSRDDIRFSYTGGLLSLQHSKKNFFIRADIAAAHVKQKTCETKFSRTQTDDILFSGGYSFVLDEKTRGAITVILGIPTHQDTILEGTQFGTGHVGLGGQFDGAYFYSGNNTIFVAARYIRFFARDISTCIANQRLEFNFNIGNVVDLFISHASRLGRRHKFEFGYNPTFVFQAHICPPIEQFLTRINFIRSNFFANYRYGFLIHEKFPSGIAAGISYGFEHVPHDIGIKYVVTVWGGWGINF